MNRQIGLKGQGWFETGKIVFARQYPDFVPKARDFQRPMPSHPGLRTFSRLAGIGGKENPHRADSDV